MELGEIIRPCKLHPSTVLYAVAGEEIYCTKGGCTRGAQSRNSFLVTIYLWNRLNAPKFGTAKNTFFLRRIRNHAAVSALVVQYIEYEIEKFNLNVTPAGIDIASIMKPLISFERGVTDEQDSATPVSAGEV